MLPKTTYSLKNRAYLFLILSSIIPLITIGYISYISMYSLLNRNTDDGIRSNMKQIQVSLSNVFANLEDSALQLAMYNGKVADDIETYLDTTDILTKYEKKKSVIESISFINASKPDIGLIFIYYANKHQVMFENQSVQPGFDPAQLPMLANGINATFYGPHTTVRTTHDSPVFSIARKVNLIEGADMYVYLETSIKLFEDLLKSQQYKLAVSSILVNDRGRIMYSQQEKDFPVGSIIDIAKLSDTAKTKEIRGGYYVFSEKGQQGWYVLSAVDTKAYSSDIRQWMGKFAFFAVVSIVASLLLGLSMWRIVYRPLRTINREIMLLSHNKFYSKLKTTGILEFDSLLAEFHDMKSKIAGLFTELEEKERKKRIIEVEKLLHQINPHFLHNTLNTVQWLARMNGQDEIDRLVALFTRVLHYNLGKEGGIVALNEEVEALQNYVDLQRIRYAYHFDVQIKVDPALLDVDVPRFIMQPIVENAIYHGLKDESGYILIEAARIGAELLITVKDNGAGMSERDIERLLEPLSEEHKKVGMGIGLSYVRYMLDVNYGDQASMDIIGEKDKGTTFILRLPISRGTGKEVRT
ncbi:cache domain-containing sensor histidine kinase [Paenibacillus sacheonensis]|uniref:histidine kinase n=1 Tax=Paenibacillus sacheonensis TaxID=742054 RepID=A0A7X5BYD4_9BACL|nr:histidine kinase [Paenibacillus sacheonensis]MBM7565485.1 two-component system sensor histidine kinase YesM [Paenibacillus sacheonensis]NBC69587.1 sensor histidine kinase [Paenibacillus sacheonensis]